MDDGQKQQQAEPWLREELSARNAEIRETERAQQQQTLLALFATGGVAAFLTSGLFAKTGEYSAAVLFAISIMFSALGHRAIYYADFLTLQSRYIVVDLSRRIEKATGRSSRELYGWEHYFNDDYTARASTPAMVGDFLLYALPQAVALGYGAHTWCAAKPSGLALALTIVAVCLASGSAGWSAVRAIMAVERRKRVIRQVPQETARRRESSQ